MKADKINKIFLGVLIIAVILLLSLSMSNAQLTFYNPIYYTGSYSSPAFYPFFPLYDPFFPAYNSISALPLYNPAYLNPVAVLPPTQAINPNPIASVSAATTLVPLTPIFLFIL